MKAVKLYIKYEKFLASVIHELGYPSSKALYKWFKEYEENGDLSKTSKRKREFTQEEKQFAVNHYIEYVAIILELFACWVIQIETFLAIGVKNLHLKLVKSGEVS